MKGLNIKSAINSQITRMLVQLILIIKFLPIRVKDVTNLGGKYVLGNFWDSFIFKLFTQPSHHPSAGEQTSPNKVMDIYVLRVGK